MTTLATQSTTADEFVEVASVCRIAAVRADGGEVEILSHQPPGGAAQRFRLRPTDRDLGWVEPPTGMVWTAFRAAEPGATCFVELVPHGGG